MATPHDGIQAASEELHASEPGDRQVRTNVEPKTQSKTMKRLIILLVVAAVGLAAGAYYFRSDGSEAATQSNGPGGGRGGSARQGGGGFGGGGFGGFGGPGGFGGFGGPRLPMSVETAPVKRADMSAQIQVVGNLIGAATVEATPKVGGRLADVFVRMGDSVSKGQRLAKIEDDELQEQIKQAKASYEVASATIRQRDADLRLAQTNLDRTRNLFERQLIPKQTYDDTDARYAAALAQLDLAKAQFAQTEARLDELKINLANTTILSPVSGFVGKRMLDPGAWVTPNSVFLSLVDIRVVRMVANVVEKDLRRIRQGLPAAVEVDAFPGEKFTGSVAHVAPILDPATRTAQIEVEIQNPQFRLKPGMYAKVNFTVEHREQALVVPTAALVDVGGNRGVFLPNKGEQGDIAKFKKIEVGLIDQQLVEVASGLTEGETVVTTGAAALREGDRIVLPGQTPPDGRSGGGRGGGRGGSAPGGRAPGGGAPPGGAPGGSGPGSGEGGPGAGRSS
jgi:HlyD family secretion protein